MDGKRLIAHPGHRIANPVPDEAEVRLESLRQLEKEGLELVARLRRLHQELQDQIAALAPRSWRVRLRHRLKMLLGVRVGILRHHPSRSLEVPDSYRLTPPPSVPPTVAIVTPSYNQGRFLERTLCSVLDQEYPRLEYVVQDGGSTDGTRAVLDCYRDRLAHWESAPDGGQANAINLGFRHTTGEIMAYLNSDDLLLPGALNYVASYFARHPEVDVVYGHRVLLDEEDGEVGRWVLPRHDSATLTWADFVPQETLFWRRRIWDRVGGLDESFQFALDWDLLLRFQEAGARFVRLPRFLGAFRVHLQQKTATQIADQGAEEMGRLRERCHGRTVSLGEIRRRILPYLLRHAIYHRLYRLGLLRY